MLINPKTTYRGENKDGDLEIRKSFSVKREDLRIRTVTKETGEDGEEIEVTEIDVPVSSLGEDRDGDRFEEDGLDDLKSQASAGTVGMWLDHGLSDQGFPDYRVQDAIGGWINAYEEDDVLRAVGHLEPDNPKAEMLESKLEKGVVPLGFSVGFIVQEAEEREDSSHGLKFRSVDLLEISAVGIPSNPDAIVSDSAVSLAKSIAKETDYDGEPADLARGIHRDFRQRFIENAGPERRNATANDHNSPMQGNKSGEVERFITLYNLLNEYLASESGEPEDPATEVLGYAEEREGIDEATIELLETLAGDEEELSAGDLLDAVLDSLEPSNPEGETNDGYGEDEEDGDDDPEGDEEEESSDDPDDPDEDDDEKSLSEEEIRSIIREEQEEARSALLDDLEERLAPTEAEREETRSGVPKPGGKIKTFEDGGNESENKGGSEGSSDIKRPTPSFGKDTEA